MVKAIIDIDSQTNQLLNIIKAQYNLKDKSQAINKLAQLFKNNEELNPSYISKAQEISKSQSIEIGTIQELKARYK
ncbi:MAG: DUF2683 family protein [Nanoarchaeota archaeon]|nr:DUF2683 family protein [Nanoarchaeota archaeon]